MQPTALDKYEIQYVHTNGMVINIGDCAMKILSGGLMYRWDGRFSARTEDWIIFRTDRIPFGTE